MPVIEFLFREYISVNLGKILKPFAQVALLHNSQREEVNMLIDSGADVTLIPKSVGDGLNLKPPERSDIKFLGGIAGGVPVAYRTIEMQVEAIKFPCRVAWAQTDDVPPVLGRVDVFDKFDIELKQSDRKVLFKVRQ